MTVMPGFTQMVYHQGTSTSMALEECVILPVPNDIHPDNLDSYLDLQIERMQQDAAQGTHHNFFD